MLRKFIKFLIKFDLRNKFRKVQTTNLDVAQIEELIAFVKLCGSKNIITIPIDTVESDIECLKSHFLENYKISLVRFREMKSTQRLFVIEWDSE